MKMTRAFLGFEFRSRLMAFAEGDGKDGDGKGDGGGGGDGDTKIDPALAKYIDNKLNTTLNDALKSHGTRLENRISEKLSGSFSETIKTALAEFKPKGDDKPDDKKADGKVSDGERRLQAQLDEMKQKLTAKDQEAETQKKTQRQREERDALQTALREKGVPEVRARAASALLYNDLGLVERDEEDKICMKVKKKVAGETFEEKVPIAEAVALWLETAEGKEFAPAVAAKGSGEGGGTRPKGGQGKPTVADAYSFVGAKIVG